MFRSSTCLSIVAFGLTFLFFPAYAQEGKERQIEERIRVLQKELDDLRAQLERLQGKEAKNTVAILEHDYQELLKKDRQAAFAQKAAQQLLETNRSSHWHSYITAMETLRKHRFQAAVPLILKYMIVHPAKDPNLGNIKTYVDTLAILTGEDVATLFANAGSAEKFAKTWWMPRKDKITVNLGRMNRDQLERVVAGLLSAAAHNDRLHRSGSSELSEYELSSRIGQLTYRYSSDRPAWYENEIHPAMLPILLSYCGAGEGAPPMNPPAGSSLRYHVIPMLAQLRKNGDASEIEKLGNDEKQPSGVRLTCLLANLVAGEDLPTETILDLYAKEKNLELRMVALLILPLTTAPRQASGTLLKTLGDPNVHIRAASVRALTTIPVPAVLPKLTKMLEAPPMSGRAGDSKTVLRAIGQLGSQEAKQVIADHLEACVNKNDGSYSVYNALYEFQTITGQRWTEAGAHDNAYYRAKAVQALAWWKEQNKRAK